MARKSGVLGRNLALFGQNHLATLLLYFRVADWLLYSDILPFIHSPDNLSGVNHRQTSDAYSLRIFAHRGLVDIDMFGQTSEIEHIRYNYLPQRVTQQNQIVIISLVSEFLTHPACIHTEADVTKRRCQKIFRNDEQFYA